MVALQDLSEMGGSGAALGQLHWEVVVHEAVGLHPHLLAPQVLVTAPACQDAVVGLGYACGSAAITLTELLR